MNGLQTIRKLEQEREEARQILISKGYPKDVMELPKGEPGTHLYHPLGAIKPHLVDHAGEKLSDIA